MFNCEDWSMYYRDECVNSELIHSKKKKYPVESINDYLKNVDFEVKFNSIYDLNNFFKEIIKQTN